MKKNPVTDKRPTNKKKKGKKNGHKIGDQFIISVALKPGHWLCVYKALWLASFLGTKLYY